MRTCIWNALLIGILNFSVHLVSGSSQEFTTRKCIFTFTAVRFLHERTTSPQCVVRLPHSKVLPSWKHILYRAVFFGIYDWNPSTGYENLARDLCQRMKETLLYLPRSVEFLKVNMLLCKSVKLSWKIANLANNSSVQVNISQLIFLNFTIRSR